MASEATEGARSDETKPHVVLPTQQPWRSLADEDLGGEEESSLLDALKEDGASRKRSAQN